MRFAELAEVEEAELGLLDPAPDLGRKVLAPDVASEDGQGRHPHELCLDISVGGQTSLTPEGMRTLDFAAEPRGAPRPGTERRPEHAAVEHLVDELRRIELELVGPDRREKQVGLLVLPRALLRLDHRRCHPYPREVRARNRGEL